MQVASCNTTHLVPEQTRLSRSSEYQQEIDRLIVEDTQNKQWARVYLQEIDTAIANDDVPAYVFFMREFEAIPLSIVPRHLRSEPGYAPDISSVEILARMRWWEQVIELYKQDTNTSRP